MKNLIEKTGYFLMIMIALILMGCGGSGSNNSNDDSDATETAQTTTSTTTTTLPTGPVLYDDFSGSLIRPDLWDENTSGEGSSLAIESGVLLATASNDGTTSGTASLSFNQQHELGYESFQADIKMRSASGEGTRKVVLSGFAYNTGLRNDNSSNIGEVSGDVSITSEGTVSYRVAYEDTSGSTEIVSTAITTVDATTTHTLLLGFDSETGTFGFQIDEDDPVTYAIDTALYPIVTKGWRSAGVYAGAFGESSGTVIAEIDNVKAKSASELSRTSGSVQYSVVEGALKAVIEETTSNKRLAFILPPHPFSTTPVTKLEADITITGYQITGDRSRTRAQLYMAYQPEANRDNGLDLISTAGSIFDGGSGLQYGGFAAHVTASDFSNEEEILGVGDVSIEPSLNQSYTLSVEYDEASNSLIQTINGQSITFDLSGVSNFNPNEFYLARINVDVNRLNNEGDSGSITATIDNVKVNGELYDDFSSGIIDPRKWIVNDPTQ
ncbi:MAG: hypothetical protein HQM14_18515 [SAR324 cluster bacterium]|nr:hypothetical protein [SAR324 cluster bacterium]